MKKTPKNIFTKKNENNNLCNLFSHLSNPFQMKTLKNVVSGVAAILVLYTTSVKAQDSTSIELKVKTSAVCGMCKENIEQALAFEKGVKKSNLDIKSQIVTVTYNAKKTTPEKIRLAISNSGYDADDVPAEPKAYRKLSACCKKDNPVHE